MATFRLTRKAREDLKSIARYTQKTWGVAQRNKYLTQLDERFAVLADAPTLALDAVEHDPFLRTPVRGEQDVAGAVPVTRW
jgi:toxin ParE1/3/4